MDKCWKKGALHTHTMWSDGCSLPETVLQSYRNAGFDFVCLTDHNTVMSDKEMWVRVAYEEGWWPPDLSLQEFTRAEAMLPENCLHRKKVSYKTFVRLKTFDELQKEWEIPEKFLVIPGEEITMIQRSFGEKECKYDLHFNTFNLRAEIPEPADDDRSGHELVRDVLAAYDDCKTEKSFLMLNHPFYHVWDVDPRILIDFPEIKFFEICNSGTGDMAENRIYERERYWDFVLAHRLDKGRGVIYGTATDDAHFYNEERANVPCAYNCAWVMVNCPDGFSPASVHDALIAGNFYSSCGVELADVEFENGTLRVSVLPETDAEYRIDFISSSKNFDRTFKIMDFIHENEQFARKRPVIPDEVGVIVKSVDGI